MWPLNNRKRIQGTCNKFYAFGQTNHVKNKILWNQNFISEHFVHKLNKKYKIKSQEYLNSEVVPKRMTTDNKAIYQRVC